MQTHTIRGNRFEINEAGFAFGPAGDLGHIEDCEAFAQLLQSLFEIAEQIVL